MAFDFGSLITSGGQAVQDLFQSEGAAAEAKSYTGASQLAQQNAALTAASTRIQETETSRQIFQAEGTQTADVASAGFTESGSALDLLRSSAQQGSLAKSLTNIQGAIAENSYAAQAGAYQGAAASAKESVAANQTSAVASIGGALLNAGQQLVDPDQVSSTDQAVSEGSSLSGALGSAENFISDTVGSIGDVVGSAFDAVSSAVVDTVSAASDGVGGIVGGIGEAAASLLSVICTAYYKQGFICYRTWTGCQRFGADCDPVTFRGYYFWGKPIADKIKQSPRIARLLFPIFKATIYEMAAQKGVGNSTFHGRALLKLFLLTSNLVGRCLEETGDMHHATQA